MAECAGCRARDHVITGMVHDVAARVEWRPIGAESASASEILAAVRTGELDAARRAWRQWITRIGSDARQWRSSAIHQKVLVGSLLKIADEKISEFGVVGLWVQESAEARAELAAAWDVDGEDAEHKVSRAATRWLRWSLSGLIEGLLTRGAPAGQQAEVAARTFEVADRLRYERGIDLLGGTEDGEVGHGDEI